MTSSSAMSPFRTISSPDNLKSDGSTRRRIRLTPEQLQILESTFLKNKKPNSKHRKQLAEQLRKPLRSIQIWFQNRRAKDKMSQKENQKFINSATLQEQISQPLPNNHHPPSPPQPGCSTPSKLAYQPSQDWLADDYNTSLPLTSQDKSVVRASQHKRFPRMSYVQRLSPVIASPSPTNSSFSLSVGSPTTLEDLRTIGPTQYISSSPAIEFSPKTLIIGTWNQISEYDKNVTLHCAYYPDMRAFEWNIQDSENCFKILTHSINFITSWGGLETGAAIRIHLKKIPLFYTKKIVDRDWRPCKDFTNNNQASAVFSHILCGCHIYETEQALFTIQSLEPTLPVYMNSEDMVFEPLKVPFLEGIMS